MAIEKALPNMAPGELDPLGVAQEQSEVNIELTDDGGALINEEQALPEMPFDGNLAEVIEDNELEKMSDNLRAYYEDDKSSRQDWEKSYVDGIKLLGFKYEERARPFQGASGVTHPLLAESATQFQAQAYKELLPAGGPVKCNIVGEQNEETEQQANRVKDYMNYQITTVMEEYDPDMDQLLFHLGLAGSAFKKIYFDAQQQRAKASFIPVEDLIVPFYATDLESCQRVTHIVKQSYNEVRKNQVGGFYRDVEIRPSLVENNQVQEEYQNVQGISSTTYGEEDDNEYTLLEFHCDLDIPGFEDRNLETGEPTGIRVPYVVTVDEGSGKVLSIYRNFREDDPLRKKIQYFVHYKFLPGLGFYGFGLIHMLGGLSRTATSALRQLIDAGTLSNLPAGFKARGLRVADDDNPIQPGEFRDVDAPSGDLRSGLLPLPYKEPSQTLFMLLGFCVDAGKRFAAVADAKIGDSNNANPVGTTMAMIEQGTKVMSAIHKRMHYAQKVEFKLLSKVFQQYLPPEYPYNVVGGNRMIKQQDFDDRVDIIPVSDPNIFSMSQRIQLAQAQLQLTGANPGIHNIYEAYRRMYQALGVNNIDAVLPPPPKPGPVDPAKENSEALKSKPLTAYPEQNHEAHIKAHRAFMSSSLVRQSLIAMAALQSHISEHISFMARQQVMEKNKEELEQLQQQLGGQQLPPELQKEMQNRLESEIAEVESTITEEIVAEEQEYLEGTGKDPLVELKTREIDIKEQDAQRKAMYDMEKLDIDRGKLDQKTEIDQKKLDQDAEIAAMRAGINLKQAKMRKN
jgi:hypothetical protein